MSISLWGEQKFAVYERFKNIRQASSLSRLELSIKTDISEKQIKNIETGRCGPSMIQGQPGQIVNISSLHLPYKIR